jgi:glucose-6-phosphate 1-epimerase
MIGLLVREQTRKAWDYAFELVLTVVLKATSLSMQLAVTNKSDNAFQFTALLHTYLRISGPSLTLLHCSGWRDARVDLRLSCLDDCLCGDPGIEKVTVEGLKGCSYADKVDGGKTKEEKEQQAKISMETDRIYKAVPGSVVIGDGGNADIELKRTGFKDVGGAGLIEWWIVLLEISGNEL